MGNNCIKRSFSEHINHWYKGNWDVYTDGSKDSYGVAASFVKPKRWISDYAEVHTSEMAVIKPVQTQLRLF